MTLTWRPWASLIAALLAAGTLVLPAPTASADSSDYGLSAAESDVGAAGCASPGLDVKVYPPVHWKPGDPPWQIVYTGQYLFVDGSTIKYPQQLVITKASMKASGGHLFEFTIAAGDAPGDLVLYVGGQQYDSPDHIDFSSTTTNFAGRPFCGIMTHRKITLKNHQTARHRAAIVFTATTQYQPPSGHAHVKLRTTTAHHGKKKIHVNARVSGDRTVIRLPRLAAGSWKASLRFSGRFFPPGFGPYKSNVIHFKVKR
jgi:hypothetical protein